MGTGAQWSLAQPQWNSSPWPSGKQVCWVGASWSVWEHTVRGVQPRGPSGGTGDFRILGCELLVGGLRGDLLRRGPPPASSPTPRRQSRWGSPSQAGVAPQWLSLVFSPRQLGSSLLSLHCLQVRLTFPSRRYLHKPGNSTPDALAQVSLTQLCHTLPWVLGQRCCHEDMDSG